MSQQGELFLAGRHVPQFDRPALGASGEALTIRAKRCRVEPTPVTFQRADLFAATVIPYPHGSVPACARQQFAIRTEDHTPDGIRVARKGSFDLPGGEIPQLDGLVSAGTGEPASVRAESDSPDGIRMADQRTFGFPGVEIPYLDRLVGSAACQPRSVWSKDHAQDAAVVPLEVEDLLRLFQIP